MKNHLFSKLGVPFEVIEKLFSMGIHTAEDFLKSAKTKKRRVMLSQRLHISEKKIAEWANRLDFLRLGDISHEVSEMFHKMGFGTIASLRHVSAEALHKAMGVFNFENKHLEDIPGIETIEKWIKKAESKDLKIFGFQIPKIHKKLEKKSEPKIKNSNYKNLLLYLLTGILGLLFLFLIFKNFSIILWAIPFLSLALGCYLRFGKDPFPSVREKIQAFLSITSEQIKQKFKKLSYKLEEINRKFHFYRKNLGTVLMILPIILGFIYMISFNTKFLDLSRFLPQKEIITVGFKDVKIGDEYFKAINFLNKEGILKGYEDQTFRPENPINRGEIMKILVEALKSIDSEKTKNLADFKNCFPDVKNQWFANSVCFAEDNSWVHGYDKGDFKPQKEVTRAESLKMILNVFQINNIASVTEDVFPDVKSYDWFAPFIAYAKESRIIDIDEKENFKPFESISRGEVSDYIYRVMKKLSHS